MIQSIYTSVSNADIVPCGKKGQIIKSDPIPLLRNNYLGEYRTELEKAKVRKNLGIADEQSLQWGNIEGFVEQQQDLVKYVEQKWLYTNAISEDITNVKEALDYTIYFISNFKSDSESIIQLQEDIKNINSDIDTVEKLISETEQSLLQEIGINSDSIKILEKSIEDINSAIEQLNESLKTIDVDANILNWIKQSLINSDSIELIEDSILQITPSKQEGNALQILQYREAVEADPENNIEAVSEILPGVYVKDLTPEIQKHSESINTIIENQRLLSENIQKNSEAIEEVSESFTYRTSLSDDTTAPSTVGGVQQGTTVSALRGKTLIEIIDTVLFPTLVRDLIYPQVYYSINYELVEVGSTIQRPELYFVQGDAGAEYSRTNVLLYNNEEVLDNTYSQLGTYTYQGSISYNSGSYLVDNKGQVTTIRVESGTIETTATVITTYPWYAGNVNNASKQQLVAFNSYSGDITLFLDGQAVIKLPGSNSQINSFKVVGLGEGYIDVDLSGWDQTTENINNIIYKVWTKKDSYVSSLSHRINFTLAL